MKLRAAAALPCLLVALATGAGVTGKDSKGHAAAQSAAPKPRPTDPRLFTLLGVTMGRAGLAPVMAQLGNAPIASRRDSPRVICYVGSDETYVVFEETDTGWGYTIYSVKTPPKDLLNSNQCKALFRLNGATPNGVGVHITQSLGELKDLLGPPQTEEKQHVSWVYSAEEAIAPGSDPRLPPDATRVLVRTKVTARLKHGGVTRLAVFASEEPLAPAAAR